MTAPIERTRALMWAGGFLIELGCDKRLPLAGRQHAVEVARHFPTIEDVSRTAAFQHPTGFDVWLAAPGEVGPLGQSTAIWTLPLLDAAAMAGVAAQIGCGQWRLTTRLPRRDAQPEL